jgi:hypothetical protein
MANATIEGRLANLEKDVAELKHHVLHSTASTAPPANWLESVIGSFENEPAFYEVLELGRAARQADRPDGSQ